MPIAILTYHSQDIGGNDYADNDHVALAEDLRHIASAGLSIVPAIDVANALALQTALPERAVVLTCDDGADLDFVDRDVPGHGLQKSFYRVLREAYPDPGQASMTSFVIADPATRATLEHTCLGGAAWLGEAWWRKAVATGAWHLGVHSWDHHHPTLARYLGVAAERSEFRGVSDHAEADLQVRAAGEYVRARAPNRGDRLFAYPYGNWTEYLTEHYFPRHSAEHRMVGAFSTEAAYVHGATHRWKIPRFVCRLHWRTPEALAGILAGL